MTIIWELDYYSRPILDEDNKKIWEVLICESPLKVDSDPETLLYYAKYCSSSQVNSIWLKAALEEAIAQATAPPSKIRFFRQAMTNMITKACNDLGITAQLSRRTFSLSRWVEQRFQEVYPNHPGFQPGTNPNVTFPEINPQPLPDALMGEKWQFATLEAVAFDEMSEWAIDFGEAFPLDLAGLTPETPVPGLLIFSSRALPLAAWMSGLELAGVTMERKSPARLLLETGVNDRWILSPLPTLELQRAVQQFEVAKQRAKGVHFLAVQSSSESEAFAGFWLLQEIKLA